MIREPWHTDYRLWALAAGSVFVALGFVDPLGGMAKADDSLWSHVSLLFEGGYNTEWLRGAIAFQTLMLAVPAVLLGWPLQAIAVIGWSSPRSWAAARKPLPPGNVGQPATPFDTRSP